MVHIDILLPGIPIWSSQGPLGYSTVALVNKHILIDTGSIGRRERLLDVLTKANIAPTDVSDVLLTHLHWDHCENLELFPEATIHVREAQLAEFRRGNPVPRTHPGLEASLEGRPVEVFDPGPVTHGIKAIDTPGHTPHHVSFTFADEPTFLFAGDAIKSASEFRPRTRPNHEGVDREWTRRIEDEITFVIPGHDFPFYVENDSITSTIDVSVAFEVKFGDDPPTTVEIGSECGDSHSCPNNVAILGGDA